jgi:hypothetical protein
MKLFSMQRKREAVKLLQFFWLMKAMFNCSENTRQRSVNVWGHERNLMDSRKDDFMKLMMQSSSLFKMYDWIK